MKLKLGLTAFVAVLVVPAVASAISLPAMAGLEMSVLDATNLYSPAGVPRPIGVPAAIPLVGDENRTVFTISPGIRRIDTFPPQTVWTPTASEELTGLFYDLKIATVTGAATALVLEFTPMGRNPLVGDVDGDTIGMPGFGGVVELYLDTTPDANISLGPGAWVPNGNPGGRDLYPTMSDGSLWASGVLAPLYWIDANGVPGDGPGGAGDPNETPIVYREVIDLVGGHGSGEGFFNITGGSAQGIFERGVFGPLRDVAFHIDVDLAGISGAYTFPLGWGWQVQSSDPVRFRTIPEPGTMLLIGSCVLGAAAYRRRRRAA